MHMGMCGVPVIHIAISPPLLSERSVHYDWLGKHSAAGTAAAATERSEVDELGFDHGVYRTCKATLYPAFYLHCGDSLLCSISLESFRD